MFPSIAPAPPPSDPPRLPSIIPPWPSPAGQVGFRERSPGPGSPRRYPGTPYGRFTARYIRRFVAVAVVANAAPVRAACLIQLAPSMWLYASTGDQRSTLTSTTPLPSRHQPRPQPPHWFANPLQTPVTYVSRTRAAESCTAVVPAGWPAAMDLEVANALSSTAAALLCAHPHTSVVQRLQTLPPRKPRSPE